MQQPLVSISCLTYNQINYLEDALKGFLMQKTNFPFEILVHDDASTDGTTEIIHRYEKQYPDIIKPIYQQVNQYSQGVKVGTFNRQRALGKYIATCEGDDYWTDPEKLQRQVDYMEAHPKCIMCSHAAQKITVDRQPAGEIKPFKHDTDIKARTIILNSGNLIATSSYLFLASAIRQLPAFYYMSPVGDYALNLFCVSQGTVHYLDRFMSVYRVNVPGSILYQHRNRNITGQIRLLQKRIDMLQSYNEFTQNHYAGLIDRKIARLRFEILSMDLTEEILTKTEQQKVLMALPLAFKTKLLVKSRLPILYHFLKKNSKRA